MHSVMGRTVLVLSAIVGAAQAATIDFNVVTLASNTTDPQLINPWGITSSGTSPLWIASNGSGVSEIYTAAGVKNAGLVVSIPGDGSVTGVAFNSTTSFNADNFLFVSEDGTVSGWRAALGSTAETLQSASADVFKGLTLDTTGGFDYALLADFHTGTIDVLKGNAAAPNLSGFVDPNLPAGFAPFNVQNLNGVIYVAYAEQDPQKHDEIDGSGLGIVDAYDLKGNFLSRVVSGGGALDAPWGLAIAPAGFGDVGGDLLVGNFGNGMINAYTTGGSFVETLQNGSGNPIVIPGLWGLRFGNGTANGGSAQSLFITAGPNGESGGQFASITAIPEPSTWLLCGLGLTVLIGLQRRARLV